MDIPGFTLAILPIALAPGASFTMAMNNAVRTGLRGVVPVIVGTAVGIYIHAMLAGLGATLLIRASSSATVALKVCGTIILIWLACRMIAAGLSPSAPSDAGHASFAGIPEAVAANLLNAKPILLYSTVLPLFAGYDLEAYFLAASIHVAVMAATLSASGVLLGTLVRRAAKRSRFGAAINLVGGSFLLALAVSSFW